MEWSRLPDLNRRPDDYEAIDAIAEWQELVEEATPGLLAQVEGLPIAPWTQRILWIPTIPAKKNIQRDESLLTTRRAQEYH
jgi:hypothetical protein